MTTKRKRTRKSIAEMKAYYIDLIQQHTRPHLYESGFVEFETDKVIKLYAPKNHEDWDAEYMSEFLHGGPAAVTDTGFVDAYGGGMIETPFEDTPVEDLERFLGVIEQFDFVKGGR